MNQNHHTYARILIVDDDAVNRRLIRGMLSSKGYHQLYEAADGIEAIEAKQKNMPDLILLDLHMPHLSGFDVCRLLRQSHHHDELPILVITQMDSNHDRIAAFDAGATDLVGKPVNKSELLARVAIHLNHKILTDDLKRYQKRIAQELRSACDVQKSLLPNKSHVADIENNYNLKITGYCHNSSELGGDMWGLTPIDADRLLVHLVDFSGHGVHAALHTIWLHSYLGHHPIKAGERLQDYMARINNALKEYIPIGHFATMILAVVNKATNQISYCSAAHPQLMMWDENGQCDHIATGKSLPLGIMEDTSFETISLPLPQAGSFFVYSDGLLHPDLSDHPINEDQINALANDLRPDAFLQHIHDHLHGKRSVPDDNTYIFIQRT